MERVSFYSALFLCLILIAPSVSNGQDVVRKTGDATACEEVADKTGKKTFVCNQSGKALMGLHWGAALLYDSSRGGVGDVKIVQEGSNSVVRVFKDDKSAARAAFELHYFIPMRGFRTIRENEDPTWGIGPFISLNTKPLDDIKGQVFTSAGIGLMVGGKVGASGQNSINFGVGWLVDTDVKRLRPGFADGTVTSLAPGHEAELLKGTTSQGLMVMLSYGFTLGN